MTILPFHECELSMIAISQLTAAGCVYLAIWLVQYRSHLRLRLSVIARFVDRLAHYFNRAFHQLPWIESGFIWHPQPALSNLLARYSSSDMLLIDSMKLGS